MSLELITLEQARIHCRADGEDDDILEQYAEAAEQEAAVSLNRAVFKDRDSMDAAIAAQPAAMAAARQARDDALEAAKEIENVEDRCFAERVAEEAYERAQLNSLRIRNGVVIDPYIKGAILLTVSHYYQNRANVVAGQGAAAVSVPHTAAEIYERLRYIGPHQ